MKYKNTFIINIELAVMLLFLWLVETAMNDLFYLDKGWLSVSSPKQGNKGSTRAPFLSI